MFLFYTIFLESSAGVAVDPLDRRMDLLSIQHETSNSSLNSATNVTKEIVQSLTPNMLSGDQSAPVMFQKKSDQEVIRPEQ